MEEEEEENMCDGVLYIDPGQCSRLSTRIGRSTVDVINEYVTLVRNHGRHYAVVGYD